MIPPLRRRTIPIVPAKPVIREGATPAPIKKKIDVAERAAIIQQLREVQHEEGYQSDYIRIMQKYKDRIRNPMTAIRSKCVECCVGQPSEVAKCTIESCSLHPFRMGSNPYNKRVAERLAAGNGDDSDNSTVENDDDDGDIDAEGGEAT